jgi:hypothetical protein
LVLVGVGCGRVGVRVGGLDVGVRLGLITAVVVGGMRVLLGKVGVMVTKRLCVSVGCGVSDAEAGVPVGTKVSVGTKAVTNCSVRAAAVSKLETAKSTMLIGSSVMGIYRLRSPIAMAETLHSKLSPIAPAARIPRGPEYSRAFTLVSLLGRLGEMSDVDGVVISICLVLILCSLERLSHKLHLIKYKLVTVFRVDQGIRSE